MAERNCGSGGDADGDMQDELRKRHARNLEAFVVRARRVGAHSLAGDLPKLAELAQGSMTVRVEGAEQTLIVDLPAEEQMESLAARVRPVILQSEATHHSKALAAVGFLAGERLTGRALDVRRNLKIAWKRIDDKQTEVRGFSMHVRDADGLEFSATDSVLAWGWFYGDVVHADLERQALTLGFSVFDRYRAASMVVAEVAYLTLATLELVQALFNEGILPLDPAAFAVDVTAGETYREMRATTFTAPVGTPVPENLRDKLSEAWTVLGDDD